MYKKVLSLLLVVAICLSLCVVPSFASAPSTNSYIKTLNTTLYGQIPVFSYDYGGDSKRQTKREFVKNFSPPLYSITSPHEHADGLLEDNTFLKVTKDS